MKTISLILVTLCPTFFGMIYAAKLKNDAKIISGILDMLRFIRFQIDTFLRPQNEIFNIYENTVLEKEMILQGIRTEISNDTVNGFSKAMKNIAEKLYLSKSEKEALFDFADSFGKHSKEVQITECDKIIKCIEIAEKRIVSELEGKVKLSYTIGASIGIGILIIMI